MPKKKEQAKPPIDQASAFAPLRRFDKRNNKGKEMAESAAEVAAKAMKRVGCKS